MAEETKSAVEVISDVFQELVSLQRSNLATSQTIVGMLLASDEHTELLDALQELKDNQETMTQKIDEVLHLVRENGE